MADKPGTSPEVIETSRDGRHFKNQQPDADSSTPNATALIQQAAPLLRTTILRLVDEIVDKFSPANCEAENELGVYVGACGVLIMLDRLLKAQDPEIAAQRGKFESAKKAYLAAIERMAAPQGKKRRRSITFHEGVASGYSILAVHYHQVKDKAKSEAYLRDLLDLKAETLATDSNEILYGKAGYLLALLYVQRHIPEAIPSKHITEVYEAIIAAGLQLGGDDCPLMFSWHKKEYLGAAHGLTGILYVLLQFPDKDTHVKLILPTIDAVVKIASHNKYQLPSRDGGTLGYTQWCHGNPGAVHLLCEAFRVTGEKKYLETAVKCQDHVWKTGLLTKGPGLCHGIAGNGYSFLDCWRLTSDGRMIHRALEFVKVYLNPAYLAKMRTPDRPWSLYEGKAGFVCFCLDLLDPSATKCFPGFQL